MRRTDVTLNINKILWEKALKKIETDFGKKYCQTDSALIIMLLALYKKKDKLRSEDNILLIVDSPDNFNKEYYKTQTICIYGELLDRLKEIHPSCTNSQIFELALADYLYLPLNFYTDCISPLYSIVGSKNFVMQKATADAVLKMQLDPTNMALVDGCCATGSLFFGLKTAEWEKVILNDLNPLRTNFLNVIKLKPLKMIKKILDSDLTFIEQPECKNLSLREMKAATNSYQEKRKKYKKVDCNIDIAYQMLLRQCIDKAMIERADKIFERLLRFLPAHLKLKNSIITQADCLTYLRNDFPKLVLLDVPYMGSEKECAIDGYQYAPFHRKVADSLMNADFPFLYFCRSSAPKSDTSKPAAEKEKIMKMKLGQLFFDKGFYFQKVHLNDDTELLISNQNYDIDKQFQWTDFHQNLL